MPLDEVVLRSYCIGAAHMALGWVTSEGLAVDDDGDVIDLTIRSFGILRAADMPPVDRGDRRRGRAGVRLDAVFASDGRRRLATPGPPLGWPTGVGFAP